MPACLPASERSSPSKEPKIAATAKRTINSLSNPIQHIVPRFLSDLERYPLRRPVFAQEFVVLERKPAVAVVQLLGRQIRFAGGGGAQQLDRAGGSAREEERRAERIARRAAFFFFDYDTGRGAGPG